MLQSLHVSKYVLIDELDVRFYPGFSVITGETGAGKSILLGALNLLLGQRADAKAIKKGAQKCVIEGSFLVEDESLAAIFERNELDYEGGECILRREISLSGKSRSFINDSLVNLSLLKEIGSHLVDIHSQHQNLQLSGKPFQLGVLDIVAQDADLLNQYRLLYASYSNACNELRQLELQQAQKQEEEDYIRFQVSQLNEANLKWEEQEELENEAELLSHAEEIKTSIFEVIAYFEGEESGVDMQLRQCTHKLQSISDYSTSISGLLERLQSAYIEIKDVASELSDLQESVQSDPQRLEFVEERLNLIYSLQQKHHVNTIEDLIELQRSLNEQLDNLENADERIAELKLRVENELKALQNLGGRITERRKAAACLVEKEMAERLIPLGMPNVKFKILLNALSEPSESGYDQVSFLFGGNKNSDMQDVSLVASGGEIARVMLSIKAIIANKIKNPTIFFDEIDTGVSGRIAESMAHTMQEMGQTCQVISITHLPQIASLGEYHYLVYKEDDATETHSHMTLLNKEQRVNEIAHMLSGSDITQAAIENARELLSHS